MYGDSSANIKETGTIEGNDCKLLGLKQNSIYYLRVCIKLVEVIIYVLILRVELLKD